eukprot:938156_1
MKHSLLCDMTFVLIVFAVLATYSTQNVSGSGIIKLNNVAPSVWWDVRGVPKNFFVDYQYLKGAVKRPTQVFTRRNYMMFASANVFSSGLRSVDIELKLGEYYFGYWFKVGLVPSVYNSSKDIVWGNPRNGRRGGWTYNSRDGHKDSALLEKSRKYGETFGTGDVIRVAVDFTAHTVIFSKNGISQGVAFSNVVGPVRFAVSMQYAGSSVKFLSPAEVRNPESHPGSLHSHASSIKTQGMGSRQNHICTSCTRGTAGYCGGVHISDEVRDFPHATIEPRFGHRNVDTYNCGGLNDCFFNCEKGMAPYVNGTFHRGLRLGFSCRRGVSRFSWTLVYKQYPHTFTISRERAKCILKRS